MKIKRLAFLLIVLIITCLLSLILSGCEQKNVTKDRLEEFMEAYNENCSYKYSGVVLVAKGDKILFNKGYGIANYDEDIPNNSSNVFAIGSITKSFTAIAIMQLQEKGLLDVNDSISKYIDGYNQRDDITIHQLLTHTSGLVRDGKFSGRRSVSLDENIDFINKCSILFEPGEDYSYSNAGYNILAAIIEKVSGKSYNDYINDNIFTPLNMNNSRGGVDDSYGNNQSIGYQISTDDPIRVYIYNFSNVIGSGNIYSTVEDLYKYDRGIYSEKLLTKESYDKIFTPYWGDWNNGYGYGWQITERYGHKKVSHGGNIWRGGYNSLIIRYPDDDYVLIFLTNNADTTALNLISETMEAIIFEKEYVKPQQIEPVNLDQEILKKYAGDYVFEDGFVISVSYKENKIYSTADDGNIYELLPINKTNFYYKGQEFVKGEFIIDKNDDIIFKIINRTRAFEGKKVKK